MKFLVHTEDFIVPEGSTPHFSHRFSPLVATVEEKARCVTVTRGDKKLIRKFKHTTFEIVDGIHKKLKVPCKSVRMWCCTKKLKARTRTIASHIKNMIQGVQGVRFFAISQQNCYKSRLHSFFIFCLDETYCRVRIKRLRGLI